MFIVSRRWQVYEKTVWENPHRGEKLETKRKGNEEQKKSIHMQLLEQSKEKINLFLLLLGISQ